VGNSGAVFLSPDGLSWFEEPSPTRNLLVHVGCGDGVLVAVGFFGTLMTSADGGVTWALQDSGTAANLAGVASGPNGFILTGSSGVVVASNQVLASRIINLSARSAISPGNPLIAGFVVGGSGTKQILVRGVGPTLSQFGVTPALAMPDLTLFSGSTVLNSNQAWGGSATLNRAFAAAGAFPLPLDSADTAILSAFAAGGYTSELAGLADSTGVGLAELYDLDVGTPTARMINISARASVGQGGNILIAGFVISGGTPLTILLRGVGPTLSQFGIAAPIAAPNLVLYDAANTVLQANSGWANNADLAADFSQVGAFPLPTGSADAAMVVTLPPGSYTVEMSGVNNVTGVGLAEVYELP
jgi:hypothetical protein